MPGGNRILSNDGLRNADVSSDNSLQVLLYDGQGNPLALPDGSAFDATKQRGLLQMGRDYKVSRMARVSPDGTMRAGRQQCIFYDSIEGVNIDTNKWVASSSTMTQAQAVPTGLLFNSSSSQASGIGTEVVSHRFFPFIGRSGLVFRCRVRHGAHFNGNYLESGFGSPNATPNTIANTALNGAHWRKDGTAGSYIPIVTVNGVEIQGTPVTQGTFTGLVSAADYFYQEIFLEESRATFKMITQAGTVINEQTVDFGTTIGTFAQTHMQAFHREINNSATGTAVQMWIAQTSVWLVDVDGPDYGTIQTQMNYGSLTAPTTYGQNANYANSAAPTSASLSNTVASYSTLGGQYQFAAVGGAETDYCLFGFQVLSPYTFICTSVRISVVNTVVAVATTATILQWGISFNGSAAALNTAGTYPNMRKAIGTQGFVVGDAVGVAKPDVVWQGRETCQPTRFFNVILKVPVGTATATEIFRGTVDVNGYFE